MPISKRLLFAFQQGIRQFSSIQAQHTIKNNLLFKISLCTTCGGIFSAWLGYRYKYAELKKHISPIIYAKSKKDDKEDINLDELGVEEDTDDVSVFTTYKTCDIYIKFHYHCILI